MEPDTIALSKWKCKWDERIEVLALRERNYKWDDILALFKMRGKQGPKRRSLYDEVRRTSKEIKEIAKAAAWDNCEELLRLAQISSDLKLNGIDAENLQKDYDNKWRRIAEMMPRNEKNGIWTAEKVRYAWRHGVSDRCQVTLKPVAWSEGFSQLVNQTKIDFLNFQG